jgi:hypothetical protein
LVVGIIVILVGVFAVATGRGGELAYEHADHAPLDLGPVSATDVALLRPPTALWGYNMQVTDEALDRIARALRDRDIEIATLQRQLADLTYGQPRRFEDGPTEPPRDFVPKHEKPRVRDDSGQAGGELGDSEQAGGELGDSEQAGGELTDSERGDCESVAPDERDASAEEQGW